LHPTDRRFFIGGPLQTLTAGTTSWRGEIADALASFGHIKDSIEYRQCGDPTLTRYYKVCSHDPAHFNRAVGHSCHLRVCELCARRESARLLKRYLPHFQAAQQAFHPTYKLRHIVLTTNWYLRDLDIVAKYRRGWKAVNALFDRLLPEGWINSGRGTFTGAEFGEDGQKLHFHVLFYGEWIDQHVISQEWERLTGCDIVWIRLVKGIKKAVKEVIKYAAKITELEPDDIARLHGVIKGSRRIRTRGIFYKVPPLPKQAEQAFCKTCGAEIVNWQPDRFSVWQKNHDHVAADSMLHLILGNKSSLPPPDRKNVKWKLVNATDYMWSEYEKKGRVKN